MIAFFRALVWLRWRLLLNLLRAGKRRDAIERLSRIGAVLVPALLLLVFGAAAILLGAFAFIGGWLLGEGAAAPAPLLLAVRLILFGVLCTLLFVPLGRSSQGDSQSLMRFLLLPIPRRALHTAEVAAGLSDPWVGFIIPGLLLLPAGLASRGRGLASAQALAAGAALLCVMACLGAVLTFLVQWLLRDRRRGEIVSVILVLLSFSAIFLVNQLDPDSKRHKGEPGGKPRVRLSADGFDRALPGWTMAIPSELYGRSIRWTLEGRRVAGFAAVAGLLSEAAALFWLSSILHRKLVESPEGSRSRRRAGVRRRTWTFRLPALSPAASAVAHAQVRAALRTVRGKLAVFACGPLLFVLTWLLRRHIEETAWASSLGGQGCLYLTGGITLALITLQPILMNQFAADGAGLTLQFVSPISDRDLVLGKAFGGAWLLCLSTLLCLAAALILGPGGSILTWLSVLLCGGATYLLVAPAAAFLSAIFPRTVDLSKAGSASNAHGAASLIGTLLTLAALGPGCLILSIGSFLLVSPSLTLIMTVVWTLLAAAISIPLVTAVARVVGRRRENLALVAQGR